MLLVRNHSVDRVDVDSYLSFAHHVAIGRRNSIALTKTIGSRPHKIEPPLDIHFDNRLALQRRTTTPTMPQQRVAKGQERP